MEAFLLKIKYALLFHFYSITVHLGLITRTWLFQLDFLHLLWQPEETEKYIFLWSGPGWCTQRHYESLRWHLSVSVPFNRLINRRSKFTTQSFILCNNFLCKKSLLSGTSINSWPEATLQQTAQIQQSNLFLWNAECFNSMRNTFNSARQVISATSITRDIISKTILSSVKNIEENKQVSEA